MEIASAALQGSYEQSLPKGAKRAAAISIKRGSGLGCWVSLFFYFRPEGPATLYSADQNRFDSLWSG